MVAFQKILLYIFIYSSTNVLHVPGSHSPKLPSESLLLSSCPTRTLADSFTTVHCMMLMANYPTVQCRFPKSPRPETSSNPKLRPFAPYCPKPPCHFLGDMSIAVNFQGWDSRGDERFRRLLGLPGGGGLEEVCRHPPFCGTTGNPKV